MRSKYTFYISTPILLLNLFSGCNSDVVKTTKPPVNPASNSLSGNNAPSPSHNNTQAPQHDQIFFSLVSSNFQGIPASIDGLGFLETDAKTTHPYSFHFANRDLSLGSHIFLTTITGILFASRSEPNSTQWSTFDPHTWVAHAVWGIPSLRIRDFASADGDTFVLVDSLHRAWVYLASSRTTTELKDLNLDADSVQIAPRSNRGLLSGTREGQPLSIIFSVKNPSKPILSLPSNSVAISPDGSKVIYSDLHQIHSLTFRTQTDEILTSSYTSIHELKWINNKDFIFVGVTPSQTALYLRRGEMGTVETISPLQVPESLLAQGLIVCPVFVGSELYFADYVSSHFSIFRLPLDRDKTSGGSIAPEVFATSTDIHVGYLCPQTLLQETP